MRLAAGSIAWMDWSAMWEPDSERPVLEECHAVVGPRVAQL